MSLAEWHRGRVRVLELDNGVTPILPLICGSLVLILWATRERRAATLLAYLRPATPAAQPTATTISASKLATSSKPSDKGAAADLMVRVTRSYLSVMTFLVNPLERSVLLLWAVLLLVLFQRLNAAPYHTLDGRVFGYALRLLVVVSYVLVFHALLTFWFLWQRLRVFLRAVAQQPLLRQWLAVPDPRLVGSPWKMWRLPATLAPLRLSLQRLRELRDAATACRSPIAKQLDTNYRDANAALDVYDSNTSGPSPESCSKLRESQLNVQTAVLTVFGILSEESQAVGHAADRELVKPLEEPATKLLAVRFAAFVHLVFRQLRELLLFACGGFVLMILTLATYPFQPRHPVMAMLWAVGFAGIVLIVVAFAEMEQDEMLSLMGGTTAGHLSLKSGFLQNVALYVAIPLLSLLAAEFPAIGQSVWALLSPLLKPLH